MWKHVPNRNYLVELERGENEVDLRILPNGTIL